MKVFVASFLCCLLFFGCGYKPSSYYAKKAISGNVYVWLDVDIENTQNSVYLKDTINEMVLHQFEANLVDKEENADTKMFVKLLDISHTSLSTDEDGYTQSYRTSVTIEVKYQTKNLSKKRLLVSDYYDYGVDTDSVSTEIKKVAAVKIALSKAVSSLFSKIAIGNMN